MKRLLGLLVLLPALAHAAGTNPTFTSVITPSLTLPGLTGLLSANGSNPVTASTTIPNGSVAGGGRTVSGTTDTILATDNLSIVDYTSSSPVAVTLPCTATQEVTFLFVAGTGQVTVTAASTACKLNTTPNGYVTLTAGVPYILTMGNNSTGSAAQWGIK